MTEFREIHEQNSFKKPKSHVGIICELSWGCDNKDGANRVVGDNKKNEEFSGN